MSETGRERTANYIAQHLTELGVMARAAGFDVLAYLIEVAKLEAEQNKR